MADKPDMHKMTDEEVKALEKSLTNFITNVKSTGRVPEALARMRMQDSEHSSHVSA